LETVRPTLLTVPATLATLLRAVPFCRLVNALLATPRAGDNSGAAAIARGKSALPAPPTAPAIVLATPELAIDLTPVSQLYVQRTLLLYLLMIENAL
jgi:hypothetical protein